MVRAGVGRRLRPGTAVGQLRLLVGALAACLALTVVAAALLGSGLQRIVEARDTVGSLNSAADALEDAFVVQMTSASAFVITGDPDALDRYRSGQTRESAAAETLRRGLDGDQEATASLDRALESAVAWRRALDAQVAAREVDQVSPAETAATAAALVLFDVLQADVEALEREVDERAEQVRREVLADQRAALWLMGFALAGFAVVLALAVRAFTRQVSRPLARLVEDAGAVASGDLQHPVAVDGPEELARVGAAVDAMRTRLLKERSVAARRSLLTGQEDERRRLAMGIHDDSVQAVLAASLRLQRLRRRMRGVDEEAVELVQAVQTDLEEAISRLRRMIFELHPPTLDRDGLEAAMRLYLGETLEPAGVSWALDVTGEVPQDPVSDALAYRLFREAVLNVLRHADARKVRVSLSGRQGDVHVEVVDDGVGFEPVERRTVPGHLGMLASRQLCEAAGGDWDVDSAPGRGTRVRYRVPGSVL